MRLCVIKFIYSHPDRLIKKTCLVRTFLLWRSPCAYGRPGALSLSRHPSLAAASEKKELPNQTSAHAAHSAPCNSLCALSLPLTRHPANSLHTRTNVLGRSRHYFCAIFATLAHTFIVKRASVTLHSLKNGPLAQQGIPEATFIYIWPIWGFQSQM